MTCIVAVEGADGITMAADSFIGGSSYSDAIAGAKIIARHGWHVGIAGSRRVQNLLEHIFAWPEAPPVGDEAIVVDVLRGIRDLIGNDPLCAGDEGQRALKLELLVVVSDELYLVGADLAAHRSSRAYQAVGSGDMFALGALAVTKQRPPKARVLAALRAAAEHCPTVRAPFHVVHVPRATPSVNR